MPGPGIRVRHYFPGKVVSDPTSGSRDDAQRGAAGVVARHHRAGSHGARGACDVLLPESFRRPAPAPAGIRRIGSRLRHGIRRRRCCSRARRCSRRAPPRPTPQTLEPVVVTASRQSQPIADALADVTVIGRDEIARAGVDSVVELLQRQPGVEIVQNGGPASVSGVFLRGANRGQTLVLVDGVRLSSASVGATRSRRFRSTRSSASRSCAGPRRASTAPMRSAA